MRQHLSEHHRRFPTEEFITVEALAPTSTFGDKPFAELVLSIALDQRAFGPRKLWVAFATYDARFLGLTYAPRTDPVGPALECSLDFFNSMIEPERDEGAAAVVLCDEPVRHGPVPSAFIKKFLRARDMAADHQVHLVDWIGCDDNLFRCARRQQFTPEAEVDWWDVPDSR